MNIKNVIIVGVALAMDAMGVSISIGLNSKVDRINKFCFILSFAFFQFLFFYIGGVAGHFFVTYVTSIPNIIGGTIIGIVGVMMIKEGFESDINDNGILFKKYMYLILGISVSIDALVVGFTAFNNINTYGVLYLNSIIIGVITMIICTTGFYLCRLIRKIKAIAKYSDFLGGIILIIFAIKMLIPL